MWRRLSLVFFAWALAGCGSDPDYSTNFTGLWDGQETNTVTDPTTGQQATTQGQATWTIEGNGRNAILLVQFCNASNFQGPRATTTSATEFNLQPYACSFFLNSCQQDVSLASGSGSLASGTLTVTLAGSIRTVGSATCPAGVVNFNISLVGTRNPLAVQAPGSARPSRAADRATPSARAHRAARQGGLPGTAPAANGGG